MVCLYLNPTHYINLHKFGLCVFAIMKKTPTMGVSMNLRKGPLSVFQLIKVGLVTANRAFGAALGLFVMLVLVSVLIVLVNVGFGMVFGYQPIWLKLITSVINGLLTTAFWVALIQVLASRMEKTGLSVVEAIQNSLLPSVYWIISSILLMIPVLLLGIAAGFSHSVWVTAVAVILILFLSIPFIFVLPVLALRQEGPIGALQYSWHLGTAHYWRILWTLFVFWLIGMMCILAVACAIKILFPVLFANPGMLQLQAMIWLAQTPKLYLLLFGLLAMGLYAFLLLVIWAIYTAFFLSLDYCNRQTANREVDVQPLAQKPVAPSIDISPEVVVKQASVATQTDEATNLHLEQVYSAKNYPQQSVLQEEDRMPTILFDEDMAQQLAENERRMQEQKDKSEKQPDEPEDEQKIQISKESL